MVKKNTEPTDPKLMTTYPIVELWWIDAEAHNGWEDDPANYKHAAPLINTVGFLVSQTRGKRGRTVIAHTHSVKCINGKMIIPTAMIQRQVILSPGGVQVDVYATDLPE